RGRGPLERSRPHRAEVCGASQRDPQQSHEGDEEDPDPAVHQRHARYPPLLCCVVAGGEIAAAPVGGPVVLADDVLVEVWTGVVLVVGVTAVLVGAVLGAALPVVVVPADVAVLVGVVVLAVVVVLVDPDAPVAVAVVFGVVAVVG